MFTSTAVLTALAGSAAGSVLWDGRLNNYTSAAFLDDWSWSNQAGPYQYYIHGSGSRDEYVKMSADYKNPADTGSDQGLQITIDDTSSWNGQTMMRTELIPQTTAAINSGKVFYHFSLQHTGTNPPSQTQEHQVCFFESHFTEMKYGAMSGQSGSSNLLHWYAGGESQWNVTFEAGVWHNVAYGIDFDAQTVTFYHSTGAEDLAEIAGPISASTTSNGADWHLGVLRLASTSGSTDSGAEDWHFSGVYIEDGELTKSVSGPGGSPGSNSAAAASTPAASSPASRQATTFQTQVKSVSSTSSSVLAHTTSTSSPSASALASNPALVFSGSLPTTSASPTATFTPAVSSYAAALSSAAAELTSDVAATTTNPPAAAETDDCEVVYA